MKRVRVEILLDLHSNSDPLAIFSSSYHVHTRANKIVRSREGDGPAIVLEEVSEGEGRMVEHAGSLASIEHVHNVDAKVALQPHHVAIRAVQYLRFESRNKMRGDRGKGDRAERIDLDNLGVRSDLVEDLEVLH